MIHPTPKRVGTLTAKNGGTKTWFELKLTLPAHLNLSGIEHVSNPVLYFNKDTDQFMCRYSVELSDEEHVEKNRVLGVDLGKFKPFSASAIDRDGTFTRELLSSKEAVRVQEKLHRVQQQLGHLYRKKNIYEALCLKGIKYQVLLEEISRVKRKRTRLKDRLSWLVGRDVVFHALDEDCSTIKVESLSFLAGRSGKWDHQRCQTRIEEHAARYGITVEKVDARNTSKEFPEPYTVHPVPLAKQKHLTRELVSPVTGEKVDRDYAASIAIACRVPKRKRRKNTTKRVIQSKRCRDKHHPTAKRAKSCKKKSQLPSHVIEGREKLRTHMPCQGSVGTASTVELVQVDVDSSSDIEKLPQRQQSPLNVP